MDKLCKKTDDQLVEMYAGGCDEAFDQLLLRHKDNLYNYISFHLTQQPPSVDDVFQETFVKAIVCMKEGRYTSQGHFGAWLTRIAHNIIADVYRSEAAMPTFVNSDEERGIFNSVSLSVPCDDADRDHEQMMRDVRTLVKRLPEEQREVVFMRYYQNRSFKEIAAQTRASVNTCLSRARYGLLNLRKMAQTSGLLLG